MNHDDRSSLYRDRIIHHPAILQGKPVVKGTRISVETVIDHLAGKPDLEDLFAAFPRLTVADVQACLAYATALIAGEEAPPVPRPRAYEEQAAIPVA